MRMGPATRPSRARCARRRPLRCVSARRQSALAAAHRHALSAPSAATSCSRHTSCSSLEPMDGPNAAAATTSASVTSLPDWLSAARVHVAGGRTGWPRLWRLRSACGRAAARAPRRRPQAPARPGAQPPFFRSHEDERTSARSRRTMSCVEKETMCPVTRLAHSTNSSGTYGRGDAVGGRACRTRPQRVRTLQLRFQLCTRGMNVLPTSLLASGTATGLDMNMEPACAHQRPRLGVHAARLGAHAASRRGACAHRRPCCGGDPAGRARWAATSVWARWTGAASARAAALDPWVHRGR